MTFFCVQISQAFYFLPPKRTQTWCLSCENGWLLVATDRYSACIWASNSPWYYDPGEGVRPPSEGLRHGYPPSACSQASEGNSNEPFGCDLCMSLIWRLNGLILFASLGTDKCMRLCLPWRCEHQYVCAWGCRCLSTYRCDNSYETPEEGVAPFLWWHNWTLGTHLSTDMCMKITRRSPLPLCDLCVFAVGIRNRQLCFGSCFSFSLFSLGLRNSPITKATYRGRENKWKFNWINSVGTSFLLSCCKEPGKKGRAKPAAVNVQLNKYQSHSFPSFLAHLVQR